MTADLAILAVLIVLVTIAAVVNGALGFGFALLSVNALAFVGGAKPAVIVMSLVAPTVSGLLAWHHRDRRAVARRLRPMLVGAVAGTFVGTPLLVLLPGAAISLVLGVFTIGYVLDSLRAERPPLAVSTQRWLGPVAGLVGGTTNATIGASGPVFGTYLTAIGLRGTDFVFAISSAFVTMSVLRVGLLAVLDQYSLAVVLFALVLVGPSILGQRLGIWFRGRIAAPVLFRATLVVLLLGGANLAVRGAMEWLGG